MIRPLKMKRVELTVLRRDVDQVLEYLGSRGVLQLSSPESDGEAAKSSPSPETAEISPSAILGRIQDAASYFSLSLSEEPG